MSLRNFIGQKQVVGCLIEQIKGAAALGRPMPPLLLTGHPGLGKTTLAQAIAREIESKLYTFSGSKSFTPQTLSSALLAAKPFDCVFIDEIHATTHDLQLHIQRIITEGVISTFAQDSARPRETGTVKIAPITIIGATDRPGLLLKALLSRFGHPLMLMPYSTDEMRDVVRNHACSMGLVLTNDAIAIVATISRGIPRDAENHLRSIQNYVAALQVSDITATHVNGYLRISGIDDKGLDLLALNYLQYLRQYSREGAKLSTLASNLSIDSAYLQRVVEPALQRMGLLRIDGRRFITLDGVRHLEGIQK